MKLVKMRHLALSIWVAVLFGCAVEPPRMGSLYEGERVDAVQAVTKQNPTIEIAMSSRNSTYLFLKEKFSPLGNDHWFVFRNGALYSLFGNNSLPADKSGIPCTAQAQKLWLDAADTGHTQDLTRYDFRVEPVTPNTETGDNHAAIVTIAVVSVAATAVYAPELFLVGPLLLLPDKIASSSAEEYGSNPEFGDERAVIQKKIGPPRLTSTYHGCTQDSYGGAFIGRYQIEYFYLDNRLYALERRD